MGRLAAGVAFLASVVRTVNEEKIRYPAAALAYYAFVSFVPLLLLVFALVGRQLAAELTRRSPRFLTPPVRRLVDQSLTTATGRTGAGLLAVLVLAWSSVNFVGDVRTVVRRVEGTEEDSLREWARDAVVVLGSLSLAILAVLVTNVLFSSPSAGLGTDLVAFAGLWATLAVVFVPLYYVPSELVTSPTTALPGAVTTSFGWTVLHTGIQFYSANAGQYAVYGVLSGVIILLTSLYLAASMLLTGVVVNAQLTAGSAAGDG